MRQRDYLQSKKDVDDIVMLLLGAEQHHILGQRESEQEWLNPALKVARRLAARLEKAV